MGNRTSAATSPRRTASAAALAEADILRAGRDAFATIATNDEANIFFVAQPGTDVVDFAARFVERGALVAGEPAREYGKTTAALDAVTGATIASRWTRPTAAVEWFIARQAAHTLLFLPGSAEPPAAAAGPVRVYTRSPVEDLHVALPVLVSDKVDATMMALLRAAGQTAWHALTARCNHACSLWVYLRIADDYWHQLCDLHRRTSGTTDAQLAQWNAWRRSADEFFQSNPFVLQQHTLVITVHNDVLSSNIVVADVAVTIARHIGYAVGAGAWGAGTPARVLAAFVSSHDYQRARHAAAVQAVALRAHTPAATVPSVRTAPGETQLDMAPAAGADASPFARLPAVHPFRSVHDF